MDTRLRIARAIGKDEGEVSIELMSQIKARYNPDIPPAMAAGLTDHIWKIEELLMAVAAPMPSTQMR